MKNICDQYPGLIYVVGDTPSHDHQALGYEYIGQRLGCNTISILNLPGLTPTQMAVLNENTSFDPEATNFYELNQFGNRTHLEHIDCNEKISAEIFVKK